MKLHLVTDGENVGGNGGTAGPKWYCGGVGRGGLGAGGSGAGGAGTCDRIPFGMSLAHVSLILGSFWS